MRKVTIHGWRPGLSDVPGSSSSVGADTVETLSISVEGDVEHRAFIPSQRPDIGAELGFEKGDLAVAARHRNQPRSL